jgi:hypothetical protein
VKDIKTGRVHITSQNHVMPSSRIPFPRRVPAHGERQRRHLRGRGLPGRAPRFPYSFTRGLAGPGTPRICSTAL